MYHLVHSTVRHYAGYGLLLPVNDQDVINVTVTDSKDAMAN